jgi:cytochrome c2
MRNLTFAFLYLSALAVANAAPMQKLGDAARGAKLIADLGCGGCHSIDGIRDAIGNVGPPLAHVGTRIYLAGVLQNTPANMVAWLRHPQRIVPRNAMPDIGLGERDARDVAAYLYELK